MKQYSQPFAHIPFPIKSFYRCCGKRLFDIFLSLIFIPLLFPLFVVISLLVFIDSGFPIVFRQKRVGKHGKVFTMYKFRTMIHNAQDLQSEYFHLNEANGPVFKIHNDPRYTRIGKVLALSGIDEVMQIINVLTGSMSFVGPRPLPLSEENGISEKRIRIVSRGKLDAVAPIDVRIQHGRFSVMQRQCEAYRNALTRQAGIAQGVRQGVEAADKLLLRQQG